MSCPAHMFHRLRNCSAEILHNNIYASDLALILKYWRENRSFLENLDKVGQADPLFDFARFKELVQEYKGQISNGSLDVLHRVGSESMQYGHAGMLCDYSGVNVGKMLGVVLPYIEHGIAYTDEIPAALHAPYTHLTISQGKYRRSAFCKKRPDIPHYCIGPYIAYAHSILNESELSLAKQKLGKTLLVFPSHTYEMSRISYGRDAFVDKVINLGRKHFDSVMVSAYWHDVDDPVFDAFERAGATVVSSGLRGDRNFISRLKSMFVLCDAVVGNGLGTHIGYAFYMRKPFRFIESEQMDLFDGGHLKKKDELHAIEREFAQAFSSFNPTNQAMVKQEKLVSEYWGTRDSVMTPSEIGSIIENCQDLLRISRGFSERYLGAFQKIWDGLEPGKSRNALQRRNMLIKGFEK